MLPPLGRLLVAGEGSWEGGVRIPDLPRRMHELPPEDQEVLVVGEHADETAAWLIAGGRRARAVQVPRVSAVPDSVPRWRLWQPNPWLAEAVRESTPSKTLDLGCGSGRDAVFLAGLGSEVCAIDHLPDAIERAKDLEIRYLGEARVQWIVGDAHDTPTGPYDLISMLRCYLPSLLDTAAERLDIGGVILIQSFSEEHRIQTGRPSNHLYIFREADLPEGFCVTERTIAGKWQHIKVQRS